MNRDVFEKFSPDLKKSLVNAQKIAQKQKSGLNTEHLLLAILDDKETISYEILASFGILKDNIPGLTFKKSRQLESISNDAKKSIKLAVHFASKFNHYLVNSEHLLLALLSDKSFHSFKLVEDLNIDPKSVSDEIKKILKSITIPEKNNLIGSPNSQNIPFDVLPLDNFFNQAPIEMPNQMPFMTELNSTGDKKKKSLLESFTVDLTQMAKDNLLDTIVGRDKELKRLTQTLIRRTKNNPILIGEPGVGKTSIVEGLAQKIIDGNVPQKLLGCQLLSLDLGSVIAGTMYRGQFENRIKEIIKEVKAKNNIILFIDEIHTIVGAGSTEGSIDAANLIKPALQKGELRLIGSTTFDEYKKHIEKDSAFERRFQPITVAEPNTDETYEILLGIRDHYQKFHNVIYSEDALRSATNLAKRYIFDRFLPDKAIDLIDEAGALANAKTVQKESGFQKLQKQLKKISKDKEEQILDENYEQAAYLKQEELRLQKKIKVLEKSQKTLNPTLITDQEIMLLVSDWTGIPVKSMSADDKKNYLKLGERLKKQVIGQDEAIEKVSEAIKRARVGINNPNRPIGSFIFLGPTGVGKTELAKVISKEICGDEKYLLKIDMSEFMEKHNLARLVGAPAGYIGYEEGGRLTEAVRKNPYSVILFDEIEKAHPEIFNILLQIMEDGYLTDAKGRQVNFKNTIIILTSNLGTEMLHKGLSIGFNKEKDFDERYQKLKENAIQTVEKTFRPEFLNRIDDILVFMPLNLESIKKIVDLQLEELTNRINDKGYKLSVSSEAKELIAKESNYLEFGARTIRKYIANTIEPLLSDAILSTKSSLLEFHIEVKNNKIKLLKSLNKKSDGPKRILKKTTKSHN